jgi:hypothetical protein
MRVLAVVMMADHYSPHDSRLKEGKTTGVQNRSRPIKLTRRFHRGKKTT